MDTLACGNANNGIIRDILRMNLGKSIPLGDIRYHTNLSVTYNDSSPSSTQRMIDCFRRENYDHMILYHDHVVKAAMNDMYSVNKCTLNQSLMMSIS